jgi:hypothetical protein
LRAIHYLLARLRSVQRPVIWAPSLLLVFLMLFAWEFWQRPEGLGSFVAIEGDDTLSREEQAVGLDLDASSFLIREIGITSKPKAPSKSSATLSDSLPSQPSVPSQHPASDVQPDQTGFDLPSGNFTFGNGQVAGSIVRSPSEAQADATKLPPNHLQAALDRLMANSPTTVSQAAPIEGTTSLNNSRLNGVSSSMPINSYTTLVEGARSIPPMSDLSAGTNVAIVAPAPVVQPVMVTQPLPAQSFGTVPNSQPIAQPEIAPVEPQPFTAPRSIPGRYIGGGNINTFSNP